MSFPRINPILSVLICSTSLIACAGFPHGPKAALTRFPIGIYAVDDPKHLSQLKQAGFDSFQTYRTNPELLAALAKEAKHLGMRMVVAPDEVLKQESFQTRDWPIDAWYLFDEPDVRDLSSAALQGLADKTRAWDPVRPQTFVIGQGSPATRYGSIADIVMMDWYPVPHLPTDSVADQIDLVMQALPHGKPFWMVVQAYDWADEVTDPIRLQMGGGLRFPSRTEIRFMSYLSILHGARGIFYFCLQKRGQTLFDYPDLWERVSGVSREIRAMQPILEHGKRIPLPFGIKSQGLEAMAWRYRMRDYLIVLNRRKDALIRMPGELLRTTWKPLFETRRNTKDLLTSTQGAWYLQPYQVIILKTNLRL